jgi:hypothetical protein
MINYIDNLFEFIGVIATVALMCVVGLLLREAIGDLIDSLKWKHKYKHRFDKPPLAKCYCKDCRYYNPLSGMCGSHSGWVVADEWFCWGAEPRKLDPEKLNIN